MNYKKKLSVVGVILFLLATAINTNISLNSHKKSSYWYGNVLALADSENEDCTGMNKYKDYESEYKSCTLYKQVHLNGSVEYTETEQSLGIGWTVIKVSGLYISCTQHKPNSCCETVGCHFTP